MNTMNELNVEELNMASGGFGTSYIAKINECKKKAGKLFKEFKEIKDEPGESKEKNIKLTKTMQKILDYTFEISRLERLQNQENFCRAFYCH